MTPRILIADDEPADVSILEIVMRDAGMSFEVEVCRDGEEASRRFAQPPPGAPWPDLVLLDLNMPRKNGREVLHEIRSRDVLHDLPVIVLTSEAAPDEIAGFRAYPNTTCLKKPYLLKEYATIVATIRAILGIA